MVNVQNGNNIWVAKNSNILLGCLISLIFKGPQEGTYLYETKFLSDKCQYFIRKYINPSWGYFIAPGRSSYSPNKDKPLNCMEKLTGSGTSIIASEFTSLKKKAYCMALY